MAEVREKAHIRKRQSVRNVPHATLTGWHGGIVVCVHRPQTTRKRISKSHNGRRK